MVLFTSLIVSPDQLLPLHFAILEESNSLSLCLYKQAEGKDDTGLSVRSSTYQLSGLF